MASGILNTQNFPIRNYMLGRNYPLGEVSAEKAGAAIFLSVSSGDDDVNSGNPVTAALHIPSHPPVPSGSCH